MSRLLQAQGLTYYFNQQSEAVFRNVDMQIHTGDKIALLGRNGTGKTTLLKLLSGKLNIYDGQSEGTITCNTTPSFLQQEDTLQPADSNTVLAALFSSQTPQLAELYQTMTELEQSDIPQAMEYANLVHEFAMQGGYEASQLFEKGASALGFSGNISQQPVSSLSGGQRRLLKLMATFATPTQLIFLDEPTNYLDDSGIAYLIDAIKNSSSACLIVSHDRWFLDEVVTQVYELKHKTLHHYQGNYSQFTASKKAFFTQQKRQKERLETDIHKLQQTAHNYDIWAKRKEKTKSGAVDKGFVGARAARLHKRTVLAKNRMAQKIDTLEQEKPWLDKHYTISFPTDIETPVTGMCLKVQDLFFAGYNDKKSDTNNYANNDKTDNKAIINHIHLNISWGEKVSLVADNGAGKTTLLKLLMQQLSATSGEVLWAKGAHIGYLPQAWQAKNNVTTAADMFSQEQSQAARTMLGALQVKGDSFFQPLTTLSEGQKRKVSWIKLMLSKPNILLLDEPTTHLDYESLELFEQALNNYKGTILLVSHDTYLRERICEREIFLKQGCLLQRQNKQENQPIQHLSK